MGFLKRFNIRNHQPPAKCYLHDSYLVGNRNGTSVMDIIEDGLTHFLHVLDLPSKTHYSGSTYLLGIVWKDTRENNFPVVDLFGYKYFYSWLNNPEVHSWVVRDNLYTRPNNISCENGLIALGLEEAYRRTTLNLDSYLKGHPDTSLRNFFGKHELLNGRVLTEIVQL